MDPQVSVILPTYNRAHFLKETFDSLAAQTFRDFEVVVIDDGSIDGTDDIIRTYSSKINLRPLRSDQNRGVSWARNRGIAASRACWIAFLDSDDLWMPQKLEKQLRFLRENPELKICQTEEIWVRNGRRVNPMKKHEKRGGMIFERCLELCVVSPSATVLSRDLLDEVGTFDETLPACEDYDLWLRISCLYPIGLISEPLITKRGGHTDQLSRKHSSMDLFRIRAILNLLANHSLSSEQRGSAEKELLKKTGVYSEGAKKRGKLEEAERLEKLVATAIGYRSVLKDRKRTLRYR